MRKELYNSNVFGIYDINSDILPKLLNVLELIIKFSNKKKDLYREKTVDSSHRAESIGKQCYDLVVKSIATHHYEEAAKLFWVLCHNKSILHFSLFKIGLVILFNLKTHNQNDLILDFFRKMIIFSQLIKWETLLEFMMCGFKYELPDVQGQAKELEKRRRCFKREENIEAVFDAYMLLLEWCKLFTGDMNVSQIQTNDEIVKPKKYDDNSDMFILKLMKVLDLCDKQDEMEEELLKYVESNPDNVNALIYICTYLHHLHPDSDRLLHYLEILAEKSISDIRTLWLIEIWRIRGVSLVKILNYCFMFLDYPTNGSNAEGWKTLWKNLKKSQQKTTEDEFESIQSLWKTRRRSWSWMYFNPQQLSKMQPNDKLIAYKAAFLLFFGEGEKYIKKVSKYHPDAFQLAESLRN